MRIEQYLQDMLDDDIRVKPFQDVAHIPLAYQNLYEFYQTRINDVPCLILYYRDHYLSVEKMKKHFDRIQGSISESFYYIIWFDALSSVQRKKLFKAGIAFIVPEQQVYLPFLFLNIQNKIMSISFVERNTFLASTQCVYIWLFYHGDMSHTIKEIAQALKLSMMSVSRAMKDLEQRKLVKTQGEATRIKRIRINLEGYWAKGKSYLVSPIVKTMYTDTDISEYAFVFFASETALSRMSMLSYPAIETVAIYEKETPLVSKFLYGSPNDLVTEQYKEVQIWKYDPSLFLVNKTAGGATIHEVDPISLFASLQHSNDVRIQNAIEKMMEDVIKNDRS
jgi:predicted DNA-binding protein YlxM (UPF0122 family)